MYRWVASVSVVIALGAVLIPSPDRAMGLALEARQAERASSIIVISLVLFVVFAIRPLGLSWRSRVFGVSMGIGLVAVVNLYMSGVSLPTQSMWDVDGVINSAFNCIADLVWVVYFWLPEPQRRFVLLPTTSPFHAWNQISEILGHDPGYVAIGGVPPEAFAPAELDIFERASRNMALAAASPQGAGTQFLNKTHYSVGGRGRSLSASEASERLTSAWKREHEEE